MRTRGATTALCPPVGDTPDSFIFNDFFGKKNEKQLVFPR
jgi:hypothetical protein